MPLTSRDQYNTIDLKLMLIIIRTAQSTSYITVYFAPQIHIAVSANRAVIDWRSPFVSFGEAKEKKK